MLDKIIRHRDFRPEFLSRFLFQKIAGYFHNDGNIANVHPSRRKLYYNMYYIILYTHKL